MKKYTPMIQQYLAIKADYKDAFLFFRLGDFYEMFFDDAKKASRILEITLTGREGGVEERIPMCGIPHHSSDTYITKLIEQGYKVAICEQVEDPKAAKGVVERKVVRIVTPGTVMDGKMLDGKSNNYLVSINFSEEKIGFSASDITTGEFYATILENNIEHLINEIFQYQPAEILVSLNIMEMYSERISKINIPITVIENQYDLYSKLANEQFSNINFDMQSISIKLSVGQLLSYIEKTQKKKIDHFNDLSIYNKNQFMVLDQFSKRNLELTVTSREQVKKGSLLWLLDETDTAMGSRLLKRWLDKPLISIDKINERLDVVEELYSDPLLNNDLTEQLAQIYDIERIISKVSYGNVNPREVFNLKKSLLCLPEIKEIINNSNGKEIKKLINNIDICEDVVKLIDNSIKEDPPISAKDGGVIKNGFDNVFDEYQEASTQGKNWLTQLQERERDLTGIKTLKVSFNKVFGYYIEVTKSHLNQIPKERYIRKQTLVNAERFITEELKEKESMILEAEAKMLDLEYKIFSQVREKIARNSYKLQQIANNIAKIDVLKSFADISLKYNYIKPVFTSSGEIFIKSGRHPVIEAINTDDEFIPNDVLIDQKNNQTIIITGPNMAGKSTYMRQIAIIVIMAQVGCYVPASEVKLSITDRIFTRIGAGDDLTSGHSTFMVEMIETQQAITQATENSLILLDEIGRGTSTYDGMALAHAIIQFIHENVKAKTLFSTHYHELTKISEQYLGIKNIHVSVIEKNDKVIFLHKIKKGKADRSYGIHVAELAGMPKEILENARIILKNIEKENSINLTNKVTSSTQQLEIFETKTIKNDNMDDDQNNKNYKKIIEEIKSIDLLNLTPMEGFQMLFDIQKQIRK